MRRLIRSLALACCVYNITAAGAQGVGNSITADHKEIGKVQAQIQKYDQAIGIVGQLNRLSSGVECNGVCYFPSSSKPIAWKCDPGRKCDLRCTVSPPVGGCN
ncbi:MAG: hypothetical protein JO320_04110 [Alphaproteobacteria bacterium]|nr:hypothetical protein [Alphaproteobacteria bacterium]